MLLRWISHALGPDMKAAAGRSGAGVAGNFPGSPDAFAFVKSLVKDVVFAGVTLGPVALAVQGGIAAANNKLAHPVAAFTRKIASGKGEDQFHQMAAGQIGLKKKAGPRAAGEAWIGLKDAWIRLLHGCSRSALGQLLPHQFARILQRFGQLARVLTAGLGHGRLAATAAVN